MLSGISLLLLLLVQMTTGIIQPADSPAMQFSWDLATTVIGYQLAIPVCQPQTITLYGYGNATPNLTAPLMLYVVPVKLPPFVFQSPNDTKGGGSFTWLPTMPIGTDFMLFMTDHSGLYGGLVGNYTMVNGSNSFKNCIVNQPPTPIVVEVASTPGQSTSLDMQVTGGVAPYTALILAPDVGLVFQATSPTATFQVNNRVPLGYRFAVFVTDGNGLTSVGSDVYVAGPNAVNPVAISSSSPSSTSPTSTSFSAAPTSNAAPGVAQVTSSVSNVGPIVGAVVGVVVALLIAIWAFLACRRSRRKKEHEDIVEVGAGYYGARAAGGQTEGPPRMSLLDDETPEMVQHRLISTGQASLPTPPLAAERAPSLVHRPYSGESRLSGRDDPRFPQPRRTSIGALPYPTQRSFSSEQHRPASIEYHPSPLPFDHAPVSPLHSPSSLAYGALSIPEASGSAASSSSRSPTSPVRSAAPRDVKRPYVEELASPETFAPPAYRSEHGHATGTAASESEDEEGSGFQLASPDEFEYRV